MNAKELKRQKQREYTRKWRAKNEAAGKTRQGQPRKRAGGFKFIGDEFLEQTREDALEALLWRATGHKDNPGHLIGVHVHAATLPLKWWEGRGQLSIHDLICAIEREMESPCVKP